MAPGGEMFRYPQHFGENVLRHGSHEWLPYSKNAMRTKSPNTNFPAGFQPAEGKKSPVSLQQRDRAFIRQKNLAVPLFLPRNAATRQRSDNRLPLYRSGSVRPTGFPVQTGRSEASIQLHPPLPRTARQLSGGGKETAFSSSTRFLYVTWIIARLSGSVKHTNAKVLSRRTSAMSNDTRKQGIVGIPSLCVCVFPLLAHIARVSGYTNPSVV